MNLLKLKAMSLGKKIYAGLWAVTGVLLITLIGMFVGLDKKYHDSTPPQEGWSTKVTGTTDQFINATSAINAKESKEVLPKYQVLATQDVKDKDGNVVIHMGDFHLLDDLQKDKDKKVIGQNGARGDSKYKEQFNSNVFLIQDLKADAAAAEQNKSHFAIYFQHEVDKPGTTTGEKIKVWVELNQANKDELVTPAVSDGSNGVKTPASLKPVKVVDEVALDKANADAKAKRVDELLAKWNNDWVSANVTPAHIAKTEAEMKAQRAIIEPLITQDPTHAKIGDKPNENYVELIVVDDKTEAVSSLYEVDAWTTKPTDVANKSINATAAVSGLWGAALVGTVFTTVGVSIYDKRKGGRK